MKLFYPDSNKVLQSLSLALLKNRNFRRYFFRLSLLFIIFCFSDGTYGQTASSIQWQKSLGGSFYDYASLIQQTTDGGFIVAGYSSSNDGDVSGNHGGYDYWILKLDEIGNLAWQKSFGGSASDEAISIQQTTDGGFIVAGSSSSNDGDVSGNHNVDGSNDYWIVKLDGSGNIAWQKCLGGSGDDQATWIQQTADGGFIVAGLSSSNDGNVSGNHGSYDEWIVKLDGSGNIVWQKSLGGPGYDVPAFIQQTTDGGFIVAGSTSSNSGNVSGNHSLNGSFDYWIVKLDANGNIIWQQCLGGTDNDFAESIQQTTDGGFIVGGVAYSINEEVSGNHGGGDDWIVKLDINGIIVWQKCLGGGLYDAPQSIKQTNDGEFIIAGLSQSNDGDVSGNHGGYDDWIVKVNASGNLVWQKCFGGSTYENAYSIQQTADGGFIVAGSSDSNNGDVSGNHGYYDYWVVKLSAEAPSCLSPANLSVTNVTATSAQLNWSIEGSPDKFLISYHAQNGSTQMRKVAGTSSSSNISNLTPATFYLWNVTAKCGSLESSLEPGQRFKTTSNREEEWSAGESLKLYPNPTSGLFTINLQTGEETTTTASIQILNGLGQTIYTKQAMIVDGMLHQEIELNNAAAGMYLVKVTSNDRVYTSQINLQK